MTQELLPRSDHGMVKIMNNSAVRLNPSAGLSYLENHRFGQFIKYGLVGVISTSLDLGVLNALVLLGHLNVYLAAPLGFTVGLINGYFLNRRWTFRYKGSNHATTFAQFALVSTIGLLLNNALLYLFIERVGLNYNIAKLIAVVIIFFWNFFWSKYWTFRSAPTTPAN